jgi:2-dehydro-3-deoxy-D-arabinonate dehydratase
MRLTRHATPQTARWALDGYFLPPSFHLGLLLELPASVIPDALQRLVSDEPATGELLAPIERGQEVWASGVTYLRSRDARVAESQTGDIYTKVYLAQRPELFFKSLGWRVVGNGQAIRVRADSPWNVPEPEAALALNRRGEIIGYCAGNDVSSRAIEAENPLYLPQAKIYDGACALGPGIQLANAEQVAALPIRMDIQRRGARLYEGQTSTASMKRSPQELAAYLFKEMSFPQGVFLLTGTGLVPPDAFSLQPGDRVRIQVGEMSLENPVA